MEQFRIPVNGTAPESCVHIWGNLRVSVLAERLLRVEYSKNGQFCDSPTQVVWNRNFSLPNVYVIREKGYLFVSTDAVAWKLNRRGRVLSMQAADGQKLSLRGNLKGTRRTLDFTFGAVKLEDGLISLGGAAVMDDSASLLLDENSNITPRTAKESDKYYFCYGSDYRGCLRDFYQLTGAPPVIPRYALGNWWSRYKAYTQQEYLNLMERFVRENIPITVATIDMDWHWVDVRRFGDLAKVKKGLSPTLLWASGWTGYSWNTELFPDWHAFLNRLHEMNFHVTVNLHPADGVRAYEDMYDDMAKATGIDPQSREPIPFDLTKPDFLKAYFNVIHHPYEDKGVDFWWIDWQQGHKFPGKDPMPGLDPLWALNHYHYYDNARAGNGLILSRFAGPGSHRYPLGFSGDSTINWKVLEFQPYFTANAANIGYSWWSHDIGGHHFGRKDDELYLRWLQFGVFSPINRLHSTSNPFAGKEPWLCNNAVRQASGDLLRLRHRLIPYLYSMSLRAHEEGIPLCEPLYYTCPNAPRGRDCRNNYLFGSELLVAPITQKIDRMTQRARTRVWFPQGRWTDIFTGQIYEGGRTYNLYRGLEQIPVFAKEGAILPLAPADIGNDSGEPEMLCVELWRGSNTFTLQEDAGSIVFSMKEENGNLLLTIESCKPRSFTLHFNDVLDCAAFSIGDKVLPFMQEIILCDVTNAVLHLQGTKVLCNSAGKEALVALISSFQLRTNEKKRVYTKWVETGNYNKKIPGRRRLKGCIQEVLDLENQEGKHGETI